MHGCPPRDGIQVQASDVGGRCTGNLFRKFQEKSPGRLVEFWVAVQRFTFERWHEQLGDEIAGRSEVKPDQFDAGNDDAPLVGQFHHDAVGMRALQMPRMLRQRQQEPLVIQIQPGLDQGGRGLVDLQIVKSLQLVVWLRLQLAISPDIADTQQRQSPDRYPHLALLPRGRG